MEKGRIIIFCDGASKGNPGRGGWGAIIAWSDNKFPISNFQFSVKELGGRVKNTTNNRMELTAVIKALKYLETKKLKSKSYKLVIYTDSAYVVNGITRWVYGWKKNGWKTKAKKTVENKKLWKNLASAVNHWSGEIKWVNISGHVGIAGNERADKIASDFAEGIKVSLYKGSRSLYAFEIEDMNYDQKKKYKKNSKSKNKDRSARKPYSYVSMVSGDIKTHATWGECEERVKGVSGTRFKKSFSAGDEKNIIEEFLQNSQSE